jgi:hypothetical protein
LLADTVIVTEKGSPEVPTSRCSKAFTDIAYSFEEEKEEEPQEERKPKPKLESNGSSELAGRMATLRSDNQEMTKEEVSSLWACDFAVEDCLGWHVNKEDLCYLLSSLLVCRSAGNIRQS